MSAVYINAHSALVDDEKALVPDGTTIFMYVKDGYAIASDIAMMVTQGRRTDASTKFSARSRVPNYTLYPITSLQIAAILAGSPGPGKEENLIVEEPTRLCTDIVKCNRLPMHTCNGILAKLPESCSEVHLLCSRGTKKELRSRHSETRELHRFMRLGHRDRCKRWQEISESDRALRDILLCYPDVQAWLDVACVLDYEKSRGSEFGVARHMDVLDADALRRMQESAHRGNASSQSFFRLYRRELGRALRFTEHNSFPTAEWNALSPASREDLLAIQTLEIGAKARANLKKKNGLKAWKNSIATARWKQIDGKRLIVLHDKHYAWASDSVDPIWPECLDQVWCYLDGSLRRLDADSEPRRALSYAIERRGEEAKGGLSAEIRQFLACSHEERLAGWHRLLEDWISWAEELNTYEEIKAFQVAFHIHEYIESRDSGYSVAAFMHLLDEETKALLSRQCMAGDVSCSRLQAKCTEQLTSAEPFLHDDTYPNAWSELTPTARADLHALRSPSSAQALHDWLDARALEGA